ncbi:alanine--tRNA ligase [Akkermansiaceae bacterium]|nr:alanine--tRNA ligase [Akkermansiaceae bacterium]MDB4669923.1 alanine--tRNA ligase [Akkermansiaceae bacterium]MDC0289304.1 alanine--tRNA ligase [Akkermansiaceae bacterium]MDC1404139.1 alanine--tRNA ligase [Akkermansiaceae bacterium]
MTSADIRQSFLDFFKEKQHTAVPSASLLPQSPGLLFTNAGMNQFVPYFLGTEKPPYSPPRAADTQKCIRAGGKHNDLEDVGYDTYHHTFFEMLGNWSFGDYFKQEAIEWGWELIVERWGCPPERLYATVYSPSEGDPSEFDQEAYDIWAKLFEAKGLDPAKHIVNGNVEDNFWKMGDTGPCGPCSELHVDMTPNGDTGGSLVNMDSDLCIEIWNLVFIQYNAEEDGTYRDLPAKHVDTGMGFERACSLIQNTKGFTDFSEKPTNYATDVFQPLFRKLEEMSGKKYLDIYPEPGSTSHTPELEEAIAFRVIADHIRTLSFSIADGILPGTNGRNYVLRRILRRAVKYGRTLGFSGDKNFLPDLVDTLVTEFGKTFPEIGTRAAAVKETLATEEESFNKTLDRGLALFEHEIMALDLNNETQKSSAEVDAMINALGTPDGPIEVAPTTLDLQFPPEKAFHLYDTFGFPIDLTALLCRERGIELDEAAVEARMEEARELSRGAQKKTIVRALDLSSDAVTEFLGFDADSCDATVLEVHQQDDNTLVITDKTVLFTEMGGQEGDTGTLGGHPIIGTQKIGAATAHIISGVQSSEFDVQSSTFIALDRARRHPIEAHHSATHLLHWALHQVVSSDATQAGSSVSPDRLRFDFNSKALTPAQVSEIEEKVNASIQNGDTVSWIEVPHADVKERADIMQFFGDKYGDLVRVVQIGGGDKTLDGFSMELCGGTHVRNTADIGLFKIKSEGAIASGVRRIEALCGPAAEAYLAEQHEAQLEEANTLNEKLSKAISNLDSIGAEHSYVLLDLSDLSDLPTKLASLKAAAINAEKALKKSQAAGAAAMADGLIAEQNITGNIVLSTEGPAALLQELFNALKKVHFSHAAFFIVDDGDKLHLGALCGEDGNNAGHGAGDLIKELAAIAGGRGGGKPDMARGAAPEREKLSELLQQAKATLGQ